MITEGKYLDLSLRENLTADLSFTCIAQLSLGTIRIRSQVRPTAPMQEEHLEILPPFLVANSFAEHSLAELIF